jgi:site-specific recombinase XerD
VLRQKEGGTSGRGHKRDALSVKQAVALLNSLGQSSLIEMRDQCMIQVLLRRGLRSIELSRLTVGSIRQQGDEPVLWVHGKGRPDADEFICLGSELYALIMKYLSMRGTPKSDDPLFATLSTNCSGNRMSTRSVRRIVKQKLHSIGILNPRVTCHSLRATAVTCSLLGGASVQETASLVRHADINSTIGYARNIEKLKMIPELAIDGLLEKEQGCA